jgi:hypothetical protein
METLKNLFTPVNDRVKSPFYSTFIVSWILVNWKIFFVLFSDDKIFEGYNKLNYLKLQISINHIDTLLLIPILFTTLYIYFLPQIDIIIFRYVTTNQAKKLEDKYRITKQYTVSGEKFIDLLLNYRKQKEELSKLDDDIKFKESEWMAKEKTHTELLNKIANLEINLQRSTPASLNIFFQGNWVCRYRSDLSSQHAREEFEIDGRFYKVINNNYTNKIEFEIRNIIFDSQSKKLTFYKIQYKSDKEFESIKYAELFEKNGKYSGTEKTYYMKSPIQIIYVNYSSLLETD